MAFKGRKVYGQSRVNQCPFCGRSAYAKNEQGVPTCTDHKRTLIEGLKCVCGSYFDIREGKWGPYALCSNCGPTNLKKALGMNDNALKLIGKKTQDKKQPKSIIQHDEYIDPYPQPKQKSNSRFHREPDRKVKEVVVRSDELDFL